MRALILAGGKGSRLRPFTFTIPKPLVPIGEMPILEILIRQLKGQGFARITLSVGHLAGLIRAFCGDGSQWGIPIDYVYEDEPLGTIGCLALLDDLDGADRLL
ncbi:MAG TPA: sugar phosphate nucleotidyltransferase, partial [Thermoanaerobaculia bacterium]|nr:sugar phosphate nucleotidyltransferase [Thermoanaerobaculia bacterium]